MNTFETFLTACAITVITITLIITESLGITTLGFKIQMIFNGIREGFYYASWIAVEGRKIVQQIPLLNISWGWSLTCTTIICGMTGKLGMKIIRKKIDNEAIYEDFLKPIRFMIYCVIAETAFALCSNWITLIITVIGAIIFFKKYKYIVQMDHN